MAFAGCAEFISKFCSLLREKPGWALFKIFAFLKYLIIIGWFCTVFGGIKYGPAFLDNTTMEFHLPKGTQSYQNLIDYAHGFWGLAHQMKITVLIQSANGHSVLGLGPQLLTLYIQEHLSSYDFRLHKQFRRVDGFYAYKDPLVGAQLANNYVSPDELSTVLVVTCATGKTSPGAHEFVDAVKTYIGRLQVTGFLPESNYTISLTGQTLISDAAKTQTLEDMEHLDLMLLPITFLILGWTIRNIPLMVIPLLAAPLSLMLAVIFIYPISEQYTFATFSASIFASLVMAMSIDYSLFLVTRYLEELRNGRENSVAVYLTLASAGKTVVVSGATLAISFFGLTIFPVESLKTIGYGASITLACTMLCSLTLTPALLLAAPRLWTMRCCACLPRWMLLWLFCDRQSHKSADLYAPADVNLAHEAETPSAGLLNGTADSYIQLQGRFADSIDIVDIDNADKRLKLLRRQQRSVWYRLAVYCAKRPGIIMIVVLVLGAPVAWQAAYIKAGSNEEALQPRGSEAYTSLRALVGLGWAGLYFPYNIVIASRNTQEDTDLFQDEFFNAHVELLEGLQQRFPEFPVSSFISPIQIMGRRVSVQEALWFSEYGYNETAYFSAEGRLWRYLVKEAPLVNPYANSHIGSGAALQVIPPWDPLGKHFPTFVKDVRAVMADLEAKYPKWRCLFAHPAAELEDMVNQVYDKFPEVIGITTAVVFVFVSIAFRSAVVSLRLLFSIFFTLAWIYGAGVMVFQYGWFDWANSAIKNEDTFYWMIPVMSFSILTGLSLDYDVFLMSRVFEYRRLGYDDVSSIVKGVYKTGKIISSAGVIMMVAFSSLLLSRELVLNQFGFLLCFGVLIDTFVVRTVFVPCVMLVQPKYNWWPSKMPAPTKDVTHFEFHNDISHSPSL